MGFPQYPYLLFLQSLSVFIKSQDGKRKIMIIYDGPDLQQSENMKKFLKLVSDNTATLHKGNSIMEYRKEKKNTIKDGIFILNICCHAL